MPSFTQQQLTMSLQQMKEMMLDYAKKSRFNTPRTVSKRTAKRLEIYAAIHKPLPGPLFTLEDFGNYEKPFNITLQRLKELENYASTTEDVCRLIRLYASNRECSTQVLDMFKPIDKTNKKEEIITDNTWKYAIGLTLFEINPDILKLNQTNFYSFIRNDLLHLYKNVLTTHYIFYLRESYNTARETLEKKTKKAEKQQKKEEKASISTLNKTISKLEQEKTCLSSQLQSAKKATEEEKKKNATIAREIAHDYQSRIKELETYIQELELKLEDLSPNGENPNDNEYDKTSCIDDKNIETLVKDVNLPSNNVLVLGGHIITVNKLRERYPNWTFIHPGSARTGMKKTNYEIAFVFTDYISHSLYRKATMMIGEETPRVYIHLTNVAAIETEMKYGYFNSVLSPKENQ